MGNNSVRHRRSKSEDAEEEKPIDPEFAFTGYMKEMEN